MALIVSKTPKHMPPRWGLGISNVARYKHVAPPALGAPRRSDLFTARARRNRIKLRRSGTESIGHAVHHPIDRCRPARAQCFEKQFPIRILTENHFAPGARFMTW
jgi:hypothetical protein